MSPTTHPLDDPTDLKACPHCGGAIRPLSGSFFPHFHCMACGVLSITGARIVPATMRGANGEELILGWRPLPADFDLPEIKLDGDRP